MKLLAGPPFDQWRDRSPEMLEHYGSEGNETCGVFRLPQFGLMVIASQGAGWDHLSVSHRQRCPTWDEMVIVKRAFFKRDEWALEYHPPEKANISLHPYCLHLWWPNDGREILTPPEWTIA